MKTKDIFEKSKMIESVDMKLNSDYINETIITINLHPLVLKRISDVNISIDQIEMEKTIKKIIKLSNKLYELTKQ